MGRSLSELNAEAAVKEEKHFYGVKAWCQSASKLFDQVGLSFSLIILKFDIDGKGDEAKTKGDLEKAYILLLRAAT